MSLAGLAAKGGRKSSGRRSGGQSKSAEHVDKGSCLVGDTYDFDDADANGESPCVDSKLPLGERGVLCSGVGIALRYLGGWGIVGAFCYPGRVPLGLLYARHSCCC